MTELVFAYGSNLSPAQIAKRCPTWGFVTKATLPGFALIFAGFSMSWGGPVATFREARRGYVRGVVFSMSAEDISRLDAFEGAPSVYERIRVRVRAPMAARDLPVHTYRLVRGADEVGTPSAAYLERIASAYRAWGMSRSQLAQAAYRCA